MKATLTPVCAQAEEASKQVQPVKAPPADIRAYLKATGLHEMRYVRMLSSLCAETYYLSKVSVRPLHACSAFLRLPALPSQAHARPYIHFRLMALAHPS